jgi:GMP synthase-like glutamine amidotransferase
VHVLAVIHGAKVRSGVFGEVAAERGHELEEWSLAWGTPPPRPIDDYGAVFVFGGAMHADQDDHHPWLRDENFFIQRLLDLHVPMLGVCLGAQLIAKACHAPVGPAPEPEIGWCGIELTGDAAGDPLFGELPARFDGFQWHHYTYGIPAGGVELARSAVCTQAFRLGDAAWGIQFHAEVTLRQIEGWIVEAGHEPSCTPEELVAESERRIGEWNELGRRLCGGFLEAAERVGAAA